MHGNLALLLLAVVLPGDDIDVTGTTVLFESFENTFGEWTAHGFVECEPDCRLEFDVSLSQEQAFDGRWSLDFTANGILDDGTVWIKRPVELDAGEWTIDLSFQFYSDFSEVNNWEVMAYIGLAPPLVEQDFAHVGKAGIEGWSPYGHRQVLAVGEPTTAWVALGYNIVWETERTHWFDAVTISGVPPQGVPGDLDGDGDVDTADLLALLASWGACASPCPPACAADLDADCQVGTSDLLILLAGWSGGSYQPS